MSPFSSRVHTPEFNKSNFAESINKYVLVELLKQILFIKFIGRSQTGAVFTAQYKDFQREVIVKTIDVSKASFDQIDNEISIYEALESLQGRVIPTFHACGYMGGILKVIVIESAGRPIKLNEVEGFLPQIRSAVLEIHKLGYIHGDIRLPNIMIKEGQIQIIDFGLSKLGESSEDFKNEMEAVDRLIDGMEL